MSKADKLFIQTCEDILTNGSLYPCERGLDENGKMLFAKWEDGTIANALGKFCVINRYDLTEEFPIITLRPVSLRISVGEILWIWQKKSNNIKELNSNIWRPWADKSGSIGKAYGYQLGVKHKYKEQGNRIKIWRSGSLPVVGAVLAPPGNLRNLQSMAFPGS